MMTLYSWGANSYSQLCHGFQSEQCLHPKEVVTSDELEEIIAVSCGGGHTFILDSNGSLFGCGSNNNGQLVECENNTKILSKIKNLQEYKIEQIECGWDSSYAITNEGSLVVWGSNKYGQLGISKDEVTVTNHPVMLSSSKIIQLSAGLRHTAVVSNDGLVFVCGRGRRGQLGVITSSGSVPMKDVDSFVKVEGVEDVQQVACGQHHTLALTSGGCLYGWGDNRYGQLGVGEACFPTPQLLLTCDPGASIQAGWTHSAILSGGRVKTWGRNDYSQLGHSLGQQQVNIPQYVTGLKCVKQLELGSEHNLALLDNGEVRCWGWNEHGNCGTGTVDNVAVPQQVSVPHPVGLIAAGAGHSIAVTIT